MAARFRFLLPNKECADALNILREDFMEPDAVGVRRAVAFLRGEGETDDVTANGSCRFCRDFSSISVGRRSPGEINLLKKGLHICPTAAFFEVSFTQTIRQNYCVWLAV